LGEGGKVHGKVCEDRSSPAGAGTWPPRRPLPAAVHARRGAGPPIGRAAALQGERGAQPLAWQLLQRLTGSDPASDVAALTLMGVAQRRPER
jgi:hypothetical protein